MLEKYTVGDFVKDFRVRIGDTAQSVPSSAVIGYLNTALRRLARIDGMAPLFERRDTFDLSAINKDGTPSVAWDLGKVGVIIDLHRLRILQASDSEVCELKPKFSNPTDFYEKCPMPEQNKPGDPRVYTVERYGGSVTKLLLDRPPKNLVSIDLWYAAFHPRIVSVEDDLQIPYEFMDLFEEMCIILHNIETSDQSNARALWEDVDVLTAEMVEFLAKRSKAEPYRRMQRSF